MLKCLKVRKNLSAFLDNELSSKMHRQIELHLSECADCLYETEKLSDMIGLVGKTERPEVPPYLWESIKHRLEVIQAHPASKEASFKVPKWSFIPAGAVIFTILFYLLIGQPFLIKHKNTQIPVAVYIQEHKSAYSEQALILDSWAESVSSKTNESTDKSQSGTRTSELDVFMEAHYGGIQTNGS